MGRVGAKADRRSGPVTLAQCEDLVARSDVSEENPHAVFERVGLVLCQEEVE